ncbi:UNKNOWN [Stylonychia lemnae]|uniref:Uncharacterized protein n=1 Tax=Stylonychia lemnae TaxID=5949 RepID=A0A077ZPR7_STYLE|nr:UNKNOWN [Stylonychia lemnae]|eukprot:CDW71454.1 UNKNOWN [Stylonychia lemnae]
MKNGLYLSIFFLVIGITQSVLIELSKKHIIDRLIIDSGFFQSSINRKLQQLHRPRFEVSLDYSTLVIEDPYDSYQKAIKYTIQGKASEEFFTSVVLTRLVPSQPWESYKNKLVCEVQIYGIEDDTELKNVVEAVVSRMAHIFSDWTNNAMQESQEQFYISHLIMYMFTRDSDYYYTNGESFFYDYSGHELVKVLGDTTEVTQSLYQNVPKHQQPRYLGITLNDQLLKKVLLVPEIIKMNVFKASVVFTKLENLYHEKELVNIIFNPKDTQLSWLESAINNIKLEFKQDRIEANIGNIEDEQMIAKGLINFFFRKFFRKLTSKPLQIPEGFPRFDLESILESFKLNVGPGYLDFSIENLDLNMIPHYGFNFVTMVRDVSTGYNNDERYKRDEYNRQQEIERLRKQQQEEIKRREEERARNQYSYL